jgi:hypothetical protein
MLNQTAVEKVWTSSRRAEESNSARNAAAWARLPPQELLTELPMAGYRRGKTLVVASTCQASGQP